MRALRAFEAAARLRSFSAAARELFLTQSAVSQQIKLLEEWYGVPLFMRGANDIVTTAQAEALLPVIMGAFDAIDAVSRELRGDGPPVTIRISALPNVAMNWLVPRLGRLQSALPGMAFDVTTALRPLADVFRDCDLAIYPFEVSSRYEFEPLLTTRMGPVLLPSRIETWQIRAPADLLAAPRIDFAHAPHAWQRWFASHGISATAAAPIARFDSQMIVIEAARAGLGVALGWSVFNDVDLSAGRLAAPFGLVAPSEQAWFLVRPRARYNPHVEPVRRWLLAEAQADPFVAISTHPTR